MEPVDAKISSFASYDHAGTSKSSQARLQKLHSGRDDEWLGQDQALYWLEWGSEDAHQPEHSQCDFQALCCGQTLPKDQSGDLQMSVEQTCDGQRAIDA